MQQIRKFFQLDLESSPSSQSTPNKRQRKFPESWLTTFKDWLEYDQGNNVMFCKLCRKHKMSGIWTTEEIDNFRQVVL